MKPLPWSHSSLEKFKNCPHQYAEVKVYGRADDSKGDAALWGDWVHERIEYHYKGYEPEWPKELLPYVPQIEAALKWAGNDEGIKYIEKEFGISSKLQPCGMEDEHVWGRGIVDYAVKHPDIETVYAMDWKTGKMKPDNRQLKLFALFVFYHFPTVATVHTSFEWLQHGQYTRAMFSRIQMPELWQEFMPDISLFAQAFKTETFPKRPSGLCNGWCPVTTCENWRPKR